MSWKNCISFLIRLALWLGERFFAFVKLIGRLIWGLGHAIFMAGKWLQDRFLDWMEARDD